ncbi:MAG: hypothetical protein J6Z14_15720, partial [Prevotella sp.]|nr:hypothetical protein [Prevotella sp.]
KCRFNVHNVHFSFFFRMNRHQNKAFSCLIGALNSPRKVNGYGADYAQMGKGTLSERLHRPADYRRQRDSGGRRGLYTIKKEIAVAS